MCNSKLSWAIVFTLTVAGVPVGTQAQEDRGVSALEEIVVTARRREENLQEVPVSIQAFSSIEPRLQSPLLQVDDGTIGRPREWGMTVRYEF